MPGSLITPGVGKTTPRNPTHVRPVMAYFIGRRRNVMPLEPATLAWANLVCCLQRLANLRVSCWRFAQAPPGGRTNGTSVAGAAAHCGAMPRFFRSEELAGLVFS